jgi:hypothetical protein|tara:strand:+ start:4875 stop:5093 length:219 start_codon:yes stop_codon:yes gene_type:complete
MGINNSPIKKEIMMLDFRISQLEIALSSLMHVVANQDEELDEFSKLLNRAEKLMRSDVDILKLLTSNKGADA